MRVRVVRGEELSGPAHFAPVPLFDDAELVEEQKLVHGLGGHRLLGA